MSEVITERGDPRDRISNQLPPTRKGPTVAEVSVPVSEHLNGLEIAWGIIANANEGRWEAAQPEWREAAERWRDEIWHPALKKYLPDNPQTEEG